MGTSSTWLQRKKISYLMHNSQNSMGNNWNWRCSLAMGFLLIFGLVWDKSCWLVSAKLRVRCLGAYIHLQRLMQYKPFWQSWFSPFRRQEYDLPQQAAWGNWLKFRGQCLPALCNRMPWWYRASGFWTQSHALHSMRAGIPQPAWSP